MRIHLLGPSGSGTSTLGKLIAENFNIPWFDSDEISWIKTDPPFTINRKRDERIKLLKEILMNNNSFVLSGAVRTWGDFISDYLDIVIYKYVEQQIRIKRLLERAKNRYGNRFYPGSDVYKLHEQLVDYTKKYETGGMDIRSRMSHLSWLNTLNCEIIRLEGDKTPEEELKIIKEIIGNSGKRQNGT